MKLVEIDKTLAEDISAQPVNEGPFDWMIRSSKIGQWLDSREGKKAQQEIAVMYIKALSAWRGYTGVKQFTPDVLVKWLSDSQRNFGLGLPVAEVKEILADAQMKQILQPRGPMRALNNDQVKQFITVLSRVNFDEIAATAKANKDKQEPEQEPAATGQAQTPDADADGRIEPTLDVVQGGKPQAQSGQSAAG